MRGFFAWISILAVIIGGLMWGLISLFGWNAVVYALRQTGQRASLAFIVYGVVGAFTLIFAYMVLTGTIKVVPRKRIASVSQYHVAEDEELPYTGRVRSPVGVGFLVFITLGIYFVYWHYKVNEEITWYDEEIEVSPSLSAVAVSLGWLFLIPAFISVFKTTRRCAAMFAHFGKDIRMSAGLATLLYAVPGLGFPMLAICYPPYLQSKLNYFWRLEMSSYLKHKKEEETGAA